MQEAGLFPHETIFEKKLGTLFIYPEQAGIQCLDLGGRARHPVGGTFFITQFRLLFEAHPLNRITGQTSILLDTISEARDTSAFMRPQISITAGIPYDILLFQTAEPIIVLQQTRVHSTPPLAAEGRADLLRALVPQGEGERPPCQVVRALLDNTIATPATVLRSLALYNLWLSLGNAATS